MIEQAREYWNPILRKPYRSKILPMLRTLSPNERYDFLLSLGQTPKRARFATQILFCCARISHWASREMTYEQAAADAVKHNVSLTAGAIRDYVRRGLIPPINADPATFAEK